MGAVTQLLTAALAGGIFAAGLALSGMTDPARVHAFLDLGSGWDPRLAFVMIGAIAVHATAAWGIRRRPGALKLPTRREIDIPLVAGAAVFGVGWGLSGWCPGPVIVAAGAGHKEALLFLGSMALGMALVPRRTRAIGSR